MTEETQKRTIDAKLAKIMAEVAYFQKDAKNKGVGYKYTSAEAVLQKVNASLSRAGIAVDCQSEVTHFNVGDKRIDATVTVALRLHDSESGETRLFQGVGQGCDQGDKAVMKATTAAHKYAYALGFCISWGDDPEADTKTDAATKPKRKRAKAKASSNGKVSSEAKALMKAIENAPTATVLLSLKGNIGAAELEEDELVPLREAFVAKRTALRADEGSAA